MPTTLTSGLDPGPTLLLALAAVAVLAALLAAAIFRQRAAVARREAGRLALTLGNGPVRLFLRTPEGWISSGSGRVAGPLDLLGSAEEALGHALAALAGEGRAFSLGLAGPDGRRWRAVGRRLADPAGVRASGEPIDAVWILDESAAGAATARLDASARAAEAEEARLRAVLDLVPLPVWARGPDLALLWCNRAYAEAVDAPAPLAAVLEDRELARGVLGRDGRELARRAARLASPQSESQAVVLQGARRLLDFTEVPEAGGTAGWARDVTDLESLQGDLARLVEAQADVLERLRSGIAVFGADHRLRFANRAYAELWGLDPAWLAGEPELGEILARLRELRRLPEVVDFQSFREQQLGAFRSVLAPVEDWLYLPDGTVVRQLTAPHPLGGLVFVHEDVTDRIALERNYNTLIAVQRESLDALREGIAVFGPDGRLKLHNPAFLRIWRLSDGDFAGAPHAADILDRTRELHEAAEPWPERRARMVAVLLGRSAARRLLHLRDGRVIDSAVAPLTDGGTLWTSSDITASHRIATALRERNEALEAADRLKSRFVANVSYELRTPLSAILGFSEMLQAGYLGELTPRQAEYTNGIVEASRRLARLIDDILDLATVEAGQAELSREPVDVRRLVEGALAMARERTDIAGQTLAADVPADIGSVRADERRLRQILYNLLANATQFSPAGGTIRVSAEREGGVLTLTVADEGPGIPEADRGRVLEAFERGTGNQGGGRPAGTGPGLGLTLVKRLVDLHGGHMAICGRAGGGSEVKIVLPVGEEAEA